LLQARERRGLAVDAASFQNKANGRNFQDLRKAVLPFFLPQSPAAAKRKIYELMS
jgi:hypothetical protein